MAEEVKEPTEEQIKQKLALLAQVRAEEKAAEDYVAKVIGKIQGLEKSGFRSLPNYNAEEAIRLAYLKIMDVKDKNSKPALQVCTKKSIAEALYHMVIQGLNPMKNQVYFIVRDDRLTMDRSYFGDVAVAKRVDPTIKSINAMVIRAEQPYKTIVSDGVIISVEHEAPLDLEDKEIIGAYAVVVKEDGSKSITQMTIERIKQSWKMSPMGGKGKLQTDYTDDACLRTVIRKTCKPIINMSDDSYQFRAGALIEAENEIEDAEHQIFTDEEMGEDAIVDGVDTSTGEVLQIEPAKTVMFNPQQAVNPEPEKVPVQQPDQKGKATAAKATPKVETAPPALFQEPTTPAQNDPADWIKD